MIRVLKGRVVVREDLRADYDTFKHIVVPDVTTANDRDAVARARTWHRGTVLAMGSPATRHGHDVPHGFKVGDRVLFHWIHNEKSWTFPWTDGDTAAVIPQECVDAVLEA